MTIGQVRTGRSRTETHKEWDDLHGCNKQAVSMLHPSRTIFQLSWTTFLHACRQTDRHKEAEQSVIVLKIRAWKTKNILSCRHHEDVILCDRFSDCTESSTDDFVPVTAAIYASAVHTVTWTLDSYTTQRWRYTVRCCKCLRSTAFCVQFLFRANFSAYRRAWCSATSDVAGLECPTNCDNLITNDRAPSRLCTILHRQWPQEQLCRTPAGAVVWRRVYLAETHDERQKDERIEAKKATTSTLLLLSSLLKVDNHLIYQRFLLTSDAGTPCTFRHCSAWPILDGIRPSPPRSTTLSVPINSPF